MPYSYIFAALLLSATTALAERTLIEGKVRNSLDGSPIPDVRIELQFRGKPLPAIHTDAYGRFLVDAYIFEAATWSRDKVFLILAIDHEGFQRWIRVLEIERPLSLKKMDVRLEPSRQEGVLESSVQRQLDGLRGDPDSDLILLARFVRGGDIETGQDVDEGLKFRLQTIISTKLQSPSASHTGPVFVKLLPVDSSTDADRLRLYGEYLNSLGVIASRADRAPKPQAKQNILVSSQFLVIPRHPKAKPPMVSMDQEFGDGKMNGISLAQRLGPQWARTTALAIARRDLRNAGADREKLKQIRGFLQSVRADSPDKVHDPLAAELETLIALVDEGLQP